MMIRNEQEYESALDRLETLWGKVGSNQLTEVESDEFNELQSAVEEYEDIECDEEVQAISQKKGDNKKDPTIPVGSSCFVSAKLRIADLDSQCRSAGLCL